MEKYGIDNFRIVLINEYQVCDRQHLEAYETLWICRLKSCNRQLPFCINFLRNKQYYQENKDRIAVYKRQHYEEHKEEIDTYKKQWYKEHKEQLKKKVINIIVKIENE